MVACIIAVPPFLRYRAGIEKEFLRICSNRIDAFTARCEAQRGPAKRIIAMGGSLLICAVRSNEAMESLAQQEGNCEIRFLSLARLQSNLDHFLPVMDRVIAAHPDILLIDSDFFSYRIKQLDVSRFLEDYGEFYRGKIKQSLLRLGRHQVHKQSDRDMMTMLVTGILNSQPTRNTQFFRSYEKFIVNREPRGVLSRGDPILALLKRLRDLGIRVVLLDLPRSRQAEEIIPAAHRQKCRELRRQLEQECGVRTLEFSYRFPLEMFRDYSHLSEPGAERYSRWLIAQTMEMVTGKGRQ